MKNISYDQAMNLLQKNNVVLIDVQLENDYRKKHIVGSINIPVEEINKKISKIIRDRNKIIIVYCLKGIRSEAAMDMLKRLGYKNIYNIEGGIN